MGRTPRSTGRIAEQSWTVVLPASTADAIQIASAGVLSGWRCRAGTPGLALPSRHRGPTWTLRGNGRRRMSSGDDAPRDEELMQQVAEGSADALGLLHRRYARLVFGVAVQTLDRASAEDLDGDGERQRQPPAGTASRDGG